MTLFIVYTVIGMLCAWLASTCFRQHYRRDMLWQTVWLITAFWPGWLMFLAAFALRDDHGGPHVS